jgi:hypothetical protein
VRSISFLALLQATERQEISSTTMYFGLLKVGAMRQFWESYERSETSLSATPLMNSHAEMSLWIA